MEKEGISTGTIRGHVFKRVMRLKYLDHLLRTRDNDLKNGKQHKNNKKIMSITGENVEPEIRIENTKSTDVHGMCIHFGDMVLEKSKEIKIERVKVEKNTYKYIYIYIDGLLQSTLKRDD